MTEPLKSLAKEISGKPARTPAVPTQTFPGGIGIINTVLNATSVTVNYNGAGQPDPDGGPTPAPVPANVVNLENPQVGQTVIVVMIGPQMWVIGGYQNENPAASIYQNLNFAAGSAGGLFFGCSELYSYGGMQTALGDAPAATIEVPTTGIYHATAQWTSFGGATGGASLCNCNISINGGQVSEATSATPNSAVYVGASASVDIDCQAGDFLSWGWYWNGTGLTIQGNSYSTYLSAYLVTPHS